MPFNLNTYLEEKRHWLEQELRDGFRKISVAPKLTEAMNYSLQAGGKRLRSILCCAAYEAVGGSDLQKIAGCAMALECIHTYSLIHDDLPAMDNDDLRRGQPTNHKVFGDATAILAGDGLLTEAFTLLAKASPALPAAVSLQIIERVAEAAGCRGMVGGQEIDMEHQTHSATLSLLENIHAHKTGKLMTVAVEIGALAAGAHTQELKPFTTYGRHIGLAFQIVDDVLDSLGQVAGKTPKSDFKQAKATFASLLGIAASKTRAQDEITQAKAAISGLGEKATVLNALADYIIDRLPKD